MASKESAQQSADESAQRSAYEAWRQVGGACKAGLQYGCWFGTQALLKVASGMYAIKSAIRPNPLWPS